MHRISLILVSILGLTAPAFAVVTPSHHGGGGGNTPTTVTGSYAITFNVNLASALPAGSTLVCKAQIVPGNNGFQYGGAQLNAQPVESAAAMAVVSGTSATCVVEIPFSWAVLNAQSGAVLSYELDAINVTGSLPVVVRTSVQQGIPEAYPASGSSVALTFTPTF